MSRHPHASYGKVNNNKPMRCRRQQEAFTNKKSAAHSPVEGRLGYEAREGNLNCSRPPRPQDSNTRCTEQNQKCWLLPVSEYWHTNPGRDTVQTKSVKYGHRLSCPQHSPSRQGTTTNKMLGAPHSSYGLINSNNTPACCRRQQEAFAKKDGSPFPGRMPPLSSSQGGKPQLLPPPSSQDSSYRKKQKHWLRVSVTVALLQSVQ